MSIGEKIKDYRLKHNIKQEDIRKKCGIVPASLSRYENGSREPRFDTVEKIADSMGVTVVELITGTSKKQMLNADTILAYCQNAADSLEKKIKECNDKIDNGKDVSNCMGAVAYYDRQIHMYKYDIPNVVKLLVEANE